MNDPQISVIVPNRNGSATIGECLDALMASHYRSFEVIVVDDCSTDDSARIIEARPCTLLRFQTHRGAGAARNAGAGSARGKALLFIDSDCMVLPDTLSIAAGLYEARPAEAQGGTYTPIPHDRDSFFSAFQSVFIHYNETRVAHPDYVAAHALLIGRDVFIKSGGFPELFLPIIEDVEFSHRLRRLGVTLRAAPTLMVRHSFRFTLVKSLKNAYRKSMFWTMYSIENRDLHSDSGTASHELKLNTLSWAASAGLILLGAIIGAGWPVIAALAITSLNIINSRGLILSYFRNLGPWSGLRALLYYALIYPIPVGMGGIAGLLKRRPCTAR